MPLDKLPSEQIENKQVAPATNSGLESPQSDHEVADVFLKNYADWAEFREKWPLTRLSTMSLHDYTSAGSEDSFTYWIENRLDELGSIWGGSSFKFGVYSRGNTVERKNDAKLSYSDSHGWYTSLGQSVEEAFEKVRGYVYEVASMAEKGDLVGIEAFPHLGEVVKWKIAFHYQDIDTPSIVNIFKKAPLAVSVGVSASESMATLQKAAMSKRPANLGVLEYGQKLWKEWSMRNLNIWKLSHGNVFTDAERETFRKDNFAVMDRNTNGPGVGVDQQGRQGTDFNNAPVGTLFYLCYGNRLQLVGQFISAATSFDKNGGEWLKRKYRVLKEAKLNDNYTANRKGWSPQGNSTFWKVGEEDLPDFESSLLKKYFDTDLAELASLSGDPIESLDHDSSSGSSDDVILLKALETRMNGFNRIYYGPPGTGKTFKLLDLLKRDYGANEANDQRYSFVTFHQSYGYEEFVEGLRPVLDTGEVKYEIRPGAFKKLCEKARNAPLKRFAMVIDEINRGNISKIFGELITLIEHDKREGVKNAVPVTLPYSGESFSIPPNIDIIGTMNTADRSLALLDTALRRRFDFEPLLPDTRGEKLGEDTNSAPLANLVVHADGARIDIRLMLERINERIEVLYDRDHCIGHAYFTELWGVSDNANRFEKLTSIFSKRIVPLLEEYFFEDWHKIRLVLGDNQKPEAAQFITEGDAHEQDLTALFGNNHGLDNYSTKRRYQSQPSAFDNPAAYIGIYQALR